MVKLCELRGQRSWWEGPQYFHDGEKKWPENKLPQVSYQARQEVKRRYFEQSSCAGTNDDGVESTMVVIDKSSQSGDLIQNVFLIGLDLQEYIHGVQDL